MIFFIVRSFSVERYAQPREKDRDYFARPSLSNIRSGGSISKALGFRFKIRKNPFIKCETNRHKPYFSYNPRHSQHPGIFLCKTVHHNPYARI